MWLCTGWRLSYGLQAKKWSWDWRGGGESEPRLPWQIPQTRWLRQQTLMLSQICRPAAPRSGYQPVKFLVRALLPHLPTASWGSPHGLPLWPPNRAFAGKRVWERETVGVSFCLSGRRSRQIEIPSLWTHLTFITSLYFLSPNPFTLGVRASTY